MKVYDIPGLNQTKAFVKCQANIVGKFVCVDDENLVGIDKSLNFIADININRPLRRGVLVNVGNQPV